MENQEQKSTAGLRLANMDAGLKLADVDEDLGLSNWEVGWRLAG